MGVVGNRRSLGVHDVAAAVEAVALGAESGPQDNPHSERTRRSRLNEHHGPAAVALRLLGEVGST